MLNMLKDKVTCLIFSCDKFSDLWDGNIKLFNENWPDRDFVTYLVTDQPTKRKIQGIDIIVAGPNLEWSERLKYALQYVKTEFVFVTLDDYFLIQKVDNSKMESIITLMSERQYDYIRLYPRPERATSNQVKGYPGIYEVDITKNYSVNLYSGFWKKDFIAFTVKEPKNAWVFEVSLHDAAIEYGARCLCSYNKEYVILDVVRKGKILHSANNYFKKHPDIYNGNRELQSRGYEIRLWWKTILGKYMPNCMIKPAKSIYMFFGGQSISSQYNDKNLKIRNYNDINNGK